MYHVFRFVLALLIATAIVSSTVPLPNKKEEQLVVNIDDATTNPSSALSTESQKVTTWEIDFDGSVSTTVSSQSTDIRTERIIDDKDNRKFVDNGDDWEAENNVSMLRFVQASEEFLTLDNRIADEGFTVDVVTELEKMSNSYVDATSPSATDDWAFATMKLSYKELFEPNAMSTSEQVFIDAVHNLNVAADAGVQSALAVLAMLDRIGILEPEEMDSSNVMIVSWQEKQARANERLQRLFKMQNFMATLALAYGNLSGRISTDVYATKTFTNLDAVCDNALSLYYRCAEENMDVIDEKGGENFVMAIRLSDQVLDSEGAFVDGFDVVAVDSLHDKNGALHNLELYRTIANNPMDESYSEALQALGDIYLYGDRAANVSVDRELAAQYYHQAADAGNAAAQANYGILLANGIGVDRDVSEALIYFHRAMQQNEAFAYYGLGRLYMTGNGVPQNVTRALELFNAAVALGDAGSHAVLGSVYYNGEEGVPVDHEAAFHHFQAAVDATDGKSSEALFNLGIMHFQGVHTPQSCLAALPLFRAVALHPDLLSRLPFSLVKGYECYQKGDYLRAYLNYRLVAELGDEVAHCNAAFLLEHHGDSILKWKWLGLTKSMEDSSNVALHEAFTLYSRAAALNDSEAIRKIGACYHEPWIGVCPSNHTRALECYERAAGLGNVEAGFNCGLMLTTGDGVLQNLTAARNCYAKCSNAAFPANVPCALVLVGLDIMQAI